MGLMTKGLKRLFFSPFLCGLNVQKSLFQVFMKKLCEILHI